MLDPGIKNEKGYFVYDSGSERDIWVQTADGKPFAGIYISLTYSDNMLIVCGSTKRGNRLPFVP